MDLDEVDSMLAEEIAVLCKRITELESALRMLYVSATGEDAELIKRVMTNGKEAL